MHTREGNYHPTTSPKEAGGFPVAGDGMPSSSARPHAGDYREESNKQATKTQLGLGITGLRDYTLHKVFAFKPITS